MQFQNHFFSPAKESKIGEGLVKPPGGLRIVGGYPINITKTPYQVYLRGCGGSIISEEWILTAAHCSE